MSDSARMFSLRDKRKMVEEGTITRGGSCDAKKRYSVGGAILAQRGMGKHRKRTKIYHCNFCGGYHLTKVGT